MLVLFVCEMEDPMLTFWISEETGKPFTFEAMKAQLMGWFVLHFLNTCLYISTARGLDNILDALFPSWHIYSDAAYLWFNTRPEND